MADCIILFLFFFRVPVCSWWQFGPYQLSGRWPHIWLFSTLVIRGVGDSVTNRFPALCLYLCQSVLFGFHQTAPLLYSEKTVPDILWFFFFFLQIQLFKPVICLKLALLVQPFSDNTSTRSLLVSDILLLEVWVSFTSEWWISKCLKMDLELQDCWKLPFASFRFSVGLIHNVLLL